MPKSSAEYSKQIRAALKVLDPEISAEPLTPESKIINTFADVLADQDNDKYTIDYQFAIDSKVGADLDKFVAMFGFARQAGRRATGTVTFSRATPAIHDIIIPAGIQIVKPATRVTPAVVFQTIATVTMFTGTISVEAPIECTISGTVGNVPAHSISSMGTSSAVEISSVDNLLATTGGTTEDTDAELRVRFKNTLFRNITGTADQYLALAIASRFANKANIIGPQSRFIEYLQIANNTPTGGQTGAISQIPYSKYTFGFDYYLTDGAIVNERFYLPRSVEFTFNSTVPPSIKVDNLTALPASTIVLFEHSYCSKNSRNDPATGVANYVDVFVSGSDVVDASETILFPSTTNNLNNTSSSQFYVQNFIRAFTNTAPSIGNRFQELLWQPVESLPGSITVNGNTYNEGTHYWLLKDTTLVKGSRQARNGIEWSASVTSSVTAGTPITISYTFDNLPIVLNELMEAHKQITTDVLVHSATERFFVVNLIVMYTPGFSRVGVDQAISVALTDFMERQNFGAVIQISDILEIAHEVPGVDNVRLATPSDGVSYGISEVAADGTTPLGVPFITDFALQDSDLPILENIVTTQRSQNTWGS